MTIQPPLFLSFRGQGLTESNAQHRKGVENPLSAYCLTSLTGAVTVVMQVISAAKKALEARGVLFLISVLSVNCQVAAAETAPSVGAVHLAEAIQRAINWHPSITEARAQVLKQEQVAEVARAGYYPQVSGGVRSGYEGRGTEREFTQALELSVSQMLYDFGKVKSEVESEKAVLLQRQAQLLMALDEIAQSTSRAVIEAWRFQQLERTAQDQVDSLTTIMDLVATRYEKGAATKSDLAQSQTRVKSATALALQYRTQKQIWQSRLASLLGEQQAVRVVEEPARFTSFSCQASLDELDVVPAITAAMAQTKQAQAISNKADARLMPTLSLNPTVTHHIERPRWRTETDRDKTEYGVFLNVEVPLYQGGALRAEKREALAAEQAAEAAVESARLSVTEVLLESASQRETLRYHKSVLAEREKYSMQTRDLYQQQYLELGSRPLLDLLNAEQDIYQTRLDQVNVQNDLSALGLSCASAKGQLRALFELAD